MMILTLFVPRSRVKVPCFIYPLISVVTFETILLMSFSLPNNLLEDQ